MSTYTPIATQILTSAANSVTFNSIPQTYTDLVLIVNMATSSASGSDSRINVRINSDSSANYSTTYLTGDGSNAFSARDTNRVQIDGAVNISSSPNFGQAMFQFPNYANTNIFKTILQRGVNVGNTSGIGTSAAVSLYRQTSAITSLTILTAGPTPGNFVSGSNFNLYGIDASLSAQAKATGGNSIYTDGTYWYHIFRSSGTFTPTQNLTADYLVVAGGGGGGSNQGGGGGAGGLRCTVGATGGGGSLPSPLSLTAQAYTVTVGAGGVGYFQNISTAGSDSTFATITSIGGAAGASARAATIPNTGGSGGGGSGGNGGAGTANQGYAGGNAFGSAFNNHASGGGGGAGAVGANGTNTPSLISGNGGNGVTTSISGTSTTYAGGGGGGAFYSGVTPGNGGTGGGASGSLGDTTPTAATANTGGGGGGCGAQINGGTGGSGGSGIVIVRYSV